MPCDLTATKLAACESGIGKLDNPISLLQIIAQLACEIADAEVGSQFISGAGAPAAAPTNPDAPAQYFDTTNDFTYNWNLGTQAWVVEPKVYHALVTQNGANPPTAVVLQNTLGGTPSYSYLGAGFYGITLAGAFPFVSTSMMIAPTYNSLSFMGAPEDGNTVQIQTTAGAVNQDDLLYGTAMKIEVYP